MPDSTLLSKIPPAVRRWSPRRALAFTGSALLTGALLSACGEAEPSEGATAPATAPAMAVEVVPARPASVADEIAATGRIEAVQAIEVRPELEGRIVRIEVREGQSVSRGTSLFKIDDAELRTQVARATAERDLARQRLARTRELKEQNATAAADLELAEASARSAQAALDQLAVRLARTTVRAPFSGVVGERFVSLGDYVSPQTRLATLQTTNPQRVAFSVPERYATELQRGQRVSFRVAALPEQAFPAEVEFVDPVVQLPARTITVKALAPNPSGVLKSGMFAEARLATQVRENAVMIPEDAIMPAPGGSNAVWVVEDGKAARREVTLGVRRTGEVEITSGVQPGEQVVVGGVMQLTEGAPVNPTVLGAESEVSAPQPSATPKS